LFIHELFLQHDNIGFDTDNILKIFDFGLAKELQESEREGDTDLYNMTGMTGALRYMAPEVGLLKPYNQKVDVYSWAMLMWYIMALEPPLGMYTPNMFLDRVFRRGYRPAIKDKWPEGIKSLIREGWDDNCTIRPSFEDIKQRLKEFAREQDPEIHRLMGDDLDRSRSRPFGTEDTED
jgi:serine/threonine protein kinase